MQRIFLIGYMGAGKTTVGRELSKILDLSFIDLDHYIEGRYMKTVDQFFKEFGEEKFRNTERRMLEEISSFEDVIISTGGGAPCFFDNMKLMKEAGTTVYLKASADELAKRLEIARTVRPVLAGRKGDDLKNFIKESLEKREPYYSQADIVFDADKMLTEQDAYEISEQLAKLLKN